MAIWRHRPARTADLPAIMGVICQAQAYLRAQAVDQWQRGYPNAASFAADIAQGVCHVFLEGGVVVGVLSLTPGPEAPYATLSGQWRNPTGEYAVIHRIAVRGDRHGTGLAMEMVNAAARIAARAGARSLRADTHRGNIPMEKLMKKLGFTACGEVDYGYTSGDPIRIAYEKLL